ncbi:MAG: M15 family metallopeptidase [Anditalea sp.]
MKRLFTIPCLFLLMTSCQPQSGKEKGQILDSLSAEGYSLKEEDAGSLDFSSDKEGPGKLEQRLIAAGLVDVKEVIPEVYVELKYSTTDNFFEKDVYGEFENCYLQPIVAEMLRTAHSFLKEEYPHLTFLIYDGVRPLSVQQILWDHLDKPDSVKPLYVADPKKGSLHNFGVAVDLTLAEAQTGEVLDMGTGYDFFGYPAYPDREDQMMREGKITPEQVANREILRKVMNKAGFQGIGSEWWHFNAFSRKVAGEKFAMVE